MTTELQSDAAPAAEDEFDSAFAEFSNQRDEPVNEPAVEAKTTEATGDTPAVEAEPKQEPEVTLSPAELAKQLEEERKRAKEFEHKFKSEIGRQTAMQRQIQELQARINEAPKSEPVAKARSPQMQKLMEDFPEIAEALEAELLQHVGSVKQEVDQKILPIEKERAKVAAQESETAVEAVRPGWKEIVRTEEFAEWWQAQPAPVRALAYSSDPADAIALIDYYSGGKPQVVGNPQVQGIKEKREQQLARHVSVRNSAPAPVADAPDDFDSAFAHFARQRERRAAR